MGTSVESSRRCRIFVIVNGCSIQVGDLLIKLSFAGTDFTDALQLLIKILLCQIRSSFQSFIIHPPAFDGVVLGIACDLTRTFGLNNPEIPDCYFSPLFLFVGFPSQVLLHFLRGSSGYAECLCHFLVYGNKSTAISLFEPFAGICLLTFTYKNHVRMNYKLLGIGSNYFIILLYRSIRNMCNKVFIGIFSTLSLCHKYAWCDRH